MASLAKQMPSPGLIANLELDSKVMLAGTDDMESLTRF